MALPAIGQPPMEDGQSSPSPPQPPQPQTIPNNPNPIKTYVHLLKPNVINALMQTLTTLPLKPVELLCGELVVKWKKQEVKQSIVQQGHN